MAYVHAGYRGYATIGGTKIRFADANIAVKQEVRTEAMVMGHHDQGAAYVFGPITVEGSISGPMTEGFITAATSTLDWACKRDSCGLLTKKDVVLEYYCDTGSLAGGGLRSRTFTDLYVNNFTMSCASGDIVNFTFDVLGRTASDWGTSPSTVNSTVEKLVTWDKVTITITAPGSGSEIASGGTTNIAWSNFDITVANNLETAYSLGQSNLFPFAIVPGMRTITGTLTGYDIPGMIGRDKWDDYTATPYSTLAINLPNSTSLTTFVRFHRVEPTLNSGMITSTVGFTGVGVQTNAHWA